MAEDGVMELVLENGTIAMRGSNSSYSFRSGRDNITDAKGQSSSWLRNLDSFMGTDYDDKLNPGSIFPRSDFDFDMFCGNNINDKNNHIAETHVVPEYNKERNNWAATNNASRFVPEILAYPKPTRNCGNCSRNGKDSLQDQQGPSGYDRVMMDQPITTQPDDEQSEAVVPKATSFKNRSCPYQDQDHHGPKHANLPQNLVQRSVPTTSLCSREASNDLSSCLRSRYEDRSSDEIENSSDKHNDERGFTAKLRPLKRVGSKDRRKRSSNGHSLYEKRRRNKINKKMRALQELIPNSNKADKATTLDQAIEYLKTLQLQVQMMSSMGPGLCMPPFILSSPGVLQAPRFNVYSPMGFGMGMGGGVGGGGSGGQAYPLPTAMFGQMFPMFPAMNRGEGPFLGSAPFLNSTSSSDAVLNSIHSQMLKNETAGNEIRKF